jgi:predicted HicB family RNase H-like nuclease
MLCYKNYLGTVCYNAAKSLFYGRVMTIPEPVTFEAPTLDQLSEEFELAVNYYLEFCQEAGSCLKITESKRQKMV